MLALAARPELHHGPTSAIDDAASQLDAMPADELDHRGVEILGDAVDRARAAGARRLDMEVEPAGTAIDRLAVRCGFITTRELLQLRRSLPVGEHTDLDVRAFEPGRDEQAWLEVNNRAFSWHPEQGGWTEEQLLARQREPWFDPDGFLLHERDGHLLGFCWTKLHHDDTLAAPGEVLGEIYVIGIDPAHQGEGLGRPLVLAGLDRLGRQGAREAMLYVEADNLPARRLYERLGFSVHQTKRWYTVDLA